MDVFIQTNSTTNDYYNNGSEFCEAAWRCFGGHEGTVIDQGRIISLFAPTVVNAAFACEMFFKAILLYEGKSIPKGRDGHNLKVLFSLIEKDKQIAISKWCLAKDDPHIHDVFCKLMETHAKDFPDIRYYIEKKGMSKMSPTTLLQISNNLSLFTRELIYRGRILEGENHA